MTLPTARAAAPDIPKSRYPALERRSALRERRPRAIRRHTGRVATRFAVLVTGDILSLLLARMVATSFAAETIRGAELFRGTPFLIGGSRFLFFVAMVLGAVFATGGH